MDVGAHIVEGYIAIRDFVVGGNVDPLAFLPGGRINDRGRKRRCMFDNLLCKSFFVRSLEYELAVATRRMVHLGGYLCESFRPSLTVVFHTTSVDATANERQCLGNLIETVKTFHRAFIKA